MCFSVLNRRGFERIISGQTMYGAIKSTLLTIGLIFGLSSPAFGQAGDWFPDELLDVDLLKVDPKNQDTYIDLGGVVLSRAGYQGSDKQHTNFYPALNAEYKGRWFLNPFNGAGVSVINKRNTTLSTSLTFNPGRDAADTPFDDPLFDFDPGAAFKVSGRYRLKYVAIGGNFNVPVFGDMKGTRGSVRISTLLPVTKQLDIAPSLAASYQSKSRMNDLYGVTAQQNLISQTGEFEYGSGFSGYSMALGALWRTKKKDWAVVGVLNYRTLTGDIKDSPLTPDDDGILAAIAVAKRFE